MTILETPEDRGERGYVWVNGCTGLVIGCPAGLKRPLAEFVALPHEAQDNGWIKTLLDKLNERISFDCKNAPLDDIVALLRTKADVNIVLDTRTIGGWRDMKVTLRADRMTSRKVIEAVCDQTSLAYTLEFNAVLISTKDAIAKALSEHKTKAYWEKDGNDIAFKFEEPDAGSRLRRAMSSVLSVDISNAPLKAVFGLIEESFDIQIALYLHRRTRRSAPPVTLRAGHITVKDALDAICKTSGLAYAVTNDVVVVSRTDVMRKRAASVAALTDPRTEKAINDALNTPISLEFFAMPLSKALDLIRSKTNANIVVDETAVVMLGGVEVSASEKDVKLRDMLNTMLRWTGLRFDVRDGAIFISTAGRLLDDYVAMTVFHDEKAWTPVAATLNKPVSLNLKAAPIDDTLAALIGQTGALIVFDDDAYRRPNRKTITLRVNDMPLKQALAWVCRQLGLAYAVKKDAIFITDEPRLWPELERSQFQVYEARGKRLAVLLDAPVSFDAAGTPLDAMLNTIAAEKRISIEVDTKLPKRPAEMRAMLRVSSVPLKEALDKLLAPHDLRYRVRDNAVYVTTAKRFAAIEKAEKRIAEAMETPITFEFENTPIAKVAEVISKKTGARVVLDTEALKGRDDLTLTLQLDKVKLKDAFEWAMRLLDLEYIVKDGTVYISTPKEIPRRKQTMYRNASPVITHRCSVR